MGQTSGTRFLFAVAALFAGLWMKYDGSLNRPAPDFSLPESYGGRVDLASYRGQPVLLVFWMTSCGICRRELPLLDKMAPEFRKKGIAVVAIHLGEREEAREYMRSHHLNLTSLADAEGSVGQAYHVSGVPKLVLVGDDGKIRRSAAGMAGESVLRDWMDVVRPSDTMP